MCFVPVLNQVLLLKEQYFHFYLILVSEKNRTNIDKIYAAGDVTNVPYKQIIIAMGEGAKVGLTAFEDLMIA